MIKKTSIAPTTTVQDGRGLTTTTILMSLSYSLKELYANKAVHA